MDIETARKWVNKRLASKSYLNFLLANLFYDGKVPRPLEGESEYTYDKIASLEENDCDILAYNPLRRPIKKKTNYLLSKPYTVTGKEEVKEYFKASARTLKDTVIELHKKGEAWWEFEADPHSPIAYKITLRKAESIVPHYTDEEKTEYNAVGYLWNYIDADEKVYKFVDFVDVQGRHRIPLAVDNEKITELPHAVTSEGKKIVFKSLPFVKLKSDSLYLLIRSLGKMYSDRYVQADDLIKENADPVAVVKNASDTDGMTLREDIKREKLVKVEGDGDFSYASKSSDYSSIDTFMKTLKSDLADQLGVVSREQELTYVTSGRALDRLYVDMDSDAAEMGDVLRDGMHTFLKFLDLETKKKFEEGFDVIFNTDKPTDEKEIIANISSSQQILSKRTLIEQHPWVDDVEEELERLKKEQQAEQPETPQQSEPREEKEVVAEEEEEE